LILQITQIPASVVCRVAMIVGMLLAFTQAQAQIATPASAPSQPVNLTLIATNKAGVSVEDARQEDFQIVDGKQPRAISQFSKDLRPVDYGLVMDNSQSLRSLLKPVILAAKSLVNSKRPDEEIFIIRFTGSQNIETVRDFTPDKAELTSGIDELHISNGQSAVIDAVGLAIKHTMEVKGADRSRRRALVLFSDGENRDSYYGIDQLIKFVREHDVQVFVVGLVWLLDEKPLLTRASPRATAEKLLEKIAQESGGRAFFPKGVDELIAVTSQIDHDLHFQYSIGFAPQGKAGEKGFRKIKVEGSTAPGREKLKAITRTGYLVPSPIQPATNK